jgi:hypothetical protein
LHIGFVPLALTFQLSLCSRIRTVNLFGSDILLSTISASIWSNRKSSRTVSQLIMSSSSLASISQVFGSLSGSDTGSSFLFSSIFASILFHISGLIGQIASTFARIVKESSDLKSQTKGPGRISGLIDTESAPERASDDSPSEKRRDVFEAEPSAEALFSVAPTPPSPGTIQHRLLDARDSSAKMRCLPYPSLS